MRQRFYFRTFHLLPFACCLLFSGCRRAPQTAAELQKALPHQFRGDVMMQGSTQPHTLVVEPHELSARNDHLLEFNKVRYQVVVGSEVLAEGDADLRGTISTPDLEIRIEQAADAAANEAMKPDTFQGHLSADLRTVEAGWTGSLGQTVKFKATAVAP